MAMYLSLYQFTQQGIEHIKESPKRLEAVKQLAKSLGGEVQQFFLLLGEFDTAVLFTAPDDETMTKINLTVCARGNVRSQTLRAFSEEEYRKLLASLP
jgi:uncharacterized protein with GYD domain